MKNNQSNQTNKTSKANQPNKANQPSKTNQPSKASKTNKASKTGLGGKGLSILFSGRQTSEEINDIEKNVLELEVDKITPHPLQMRTYFDEEKINELSISIQNFGILEPILVSKKENKFELIAGERRWRAAKKAGLKTIPAIINQQSPDKIIEMMLIENIQREDLNLIEEARSFKLILEKKNVTQNELAASIGKNRTHITNLLRILRLPHFVLQDMEAGKISLGQAKVLVGLEKEQISSLHQLIVNNHLTVREIERRVHALKNPPLQKKKTPAKKTPDLDLREMEKLFREKLTNKVLIKAIKNKVGKIEIEYYHYDELMDLLKRIK